MTRLVAALVCVLFVSGSAMADKLTGTILHKDGSKVAKTRKITTSWNSEKGTYPKNGEYVIDFKGKVGKKITVYVDGDKVGEVEVKGDTTFNIRLTK